MSYSRGNKYGQGRGRSYGGGAGRGFNRGSPSPKPQLLCKSLIYHFSYCINFIVLGCTHRTALIFWWFIILQNSSLDYGSNIIPCHRKQTNFITCTSQK